MLKKLVIGWYLLGALALGILIQCSPDTPYGQGIQVGNARYESPSGYTLQYSDKLVKSESYDGKTVTFDNSKLVKPGDPISKATLVVREESFRGPMSELLRRARIQYEGREFVETTLSGARGYFSSESTTSSKDLVYFLVTVKNAIIDAHIKAYEAGEGFALVGSLMATGFNGTGSTRTRVPDTAPSPKYPSTGGGGTYHYDPHWGLPVEMVPPEHKPSGTSR